MLNKIINFFLPDHCALCNTPLTHVVSSICQDCILDINYLQNTCKSCARPLEDEHSIICGKCVEQPPLWQEAIVPLAYKDATSFLLKQLKFNRQLSLIKPLAQLFINSIKDKQLQKPDLIIPVPLHRKRLVTRGFNQSFTLAKIIGHELEIPVVPNVCWRVKNTKAQTGLSAKDRKQNLKQAFVLKKPEVIKQKHIVLFDDVYTTGSTLKELARICKMANRIDIWCMAKVISDSGT